MQQCRVGSSAVAGLPRFPGEAGLPAATRSFSGRSKQAGKDEEQAGRRQKSE
jgi:hypothetical protein